MKIVDFSVSGALVETRRQVTGGQRCEFILSRSREQTFIAVWVEVARCEVYDIDIIARTVTYRIALQFDELPVSEAMQLIKLVGKVEEKEPKRK